jgi:hypothetical protein
LIELQGVEVSDLLKIKDLLINKVESQEKNLEIFKFQPKKLQIKLKFIQILMILQQSNLTIFTTIMVLLLVLMI